ncbi:Leucine_rich repeats-containing protein [Hexamita inflata]|uniref:Leucine rich repeats-containing protein n=1 Tax=Hexamita inflata TaxID=28002 RepID=A0AA86U4W8_9EUKA|nr:Leucine rich repeats-containing protein [Hexamita inflata]
MTINDNDHQMQQKYNQEAIQNKNIIINEEIAGNYNIQQCLNGQQWINKEITKENSKIQPQTYDQQMAEKYHSKITSDSVPSLRIDSDKQLNDFYFVQNLNQCMLQIVSCDSVNFSRTPNNITHLEIIACNLTSIKGISKMKLVTLDLTYNEIVNAHELRFLTNLKELNISRNNIFSLQFAQGLNLKILAAAHNKIQCVQYLRSKYELLDLSFNNINTDEFKTLRSEKLVKYGQDKPNRTYKAEKAVFGAEELVKGLRSANNIKKCYLEDKQNIQEKIQNNITLVIHALKLFAEFLRGDQEQ